MGRDAYSEFCWRNLRERGNLEESWVGKWITLSCIFREWDEGAWTRVTWLRIRSDGGLL
jgi:hypothetical protein